MAEKRLLFDQAHVAYLSMEIGIDPEMPTYSGGLGVLAGDTLRSAADLELPIIGVTLLYKKGFFTQRIDEQGNQYEEEVAWDPSKHMEKLDTTVSVIIEGREVKISAWLYWINGVTGRKNPILFLDTDLSENEERDRYITEKLYGGDRAYRLTQEIVLGVGGVRMLRALKCTSLRKYHMNEGHSALLTLDLLQEHSMDEVREKCVFTTHTPVPAGHDEFDQSMAERMLGDLVTDEHRDDIFVGGKLNMTHVGLQFSNFVNGVAQKHGEVSRAMFPGYHIEHITNGIHSAFWVAEPLRKLFDKYIPGWKTDPFHLRYVLSIPKEDIWEAHEESKKRLLSWVNEKYNADMSPEHLTIGFARRAATYKRGDMLFADLKRLKQIAKKYPLQIIYAGKAHPSDGGGKDVIKRIITKMREVSDTIKVCYVEDYDIPKARQLVAGVDVWLNTPLRPREASGTSGMKAAHNGVPQLSVLDGWWLEGHIEKVTGWSIGAHPTGTPEPNHDEEVNDMYTKLEYVILPRFYNERDRWIDVMKHAIAINGSFFNTHRMVQQYVLEAYFE
jgi:starch phosphorylase